jgi:hypothetical protein
MSTYVAPDQIVSEGTLERATVVAFNLAMCHGVRSYNAIQWFFPQRGEKFNPGRWYINTCTGQHHGD